MNWIAFLSFVFIASWTPGPNNILSMINANKVGYKKTVFFCLGVTTGFSLLVFISIYFNYWLYEVMPKIKIVMGIIGALYMLYLAYIILKSNSHDNSKERVYKIATFKQGILMQYINPKAILFSITVSSNFIVPNFNSWYSYVLISISLGLVAFFATSTWAIMGSVLNTIFAKYEKIFNRVMAGLLVYSALSISGII
ncbi:LysE family transporter [Marinitoga arctica]